MVYFTACGVDAVEREGLRMDDLISRQAAIDALEGEIEVIGKANAEAVLKYTKMVCDRIKALPSAQPEVIPHRNYKYLSDYW